jgi:hypothetical protein
MSPLRWTCKSAAKLAGALTAQGWVTAVDTEKEETGRRFQACRTEVAADRRARAGETKVTVPIAGQRGE